VRQATGYSLYPAYFSSTAPHALKGADGYRTINEKLDELRLATQKACRRLEDEGQLSNSTLAPLLKAAATSLHGRPTKPVISNQHIKLAPMQTSNTPPIGEKPRINGAFLGKLR
jgi:hypothetical protein